MGLKLLIFIGLWYKAAWLCRFSYTSFTITSNPFDRICIASAWAFFFGFRQDISGIIIDISGEFFVILCQVPIPTEGSIPVVFALSTYSGATVAIRVPVNQIPGSLSVCLYKRTFHPHHTRCNPAGRLFLPLPGFLQRAVRKHPSRSF